MLSHGSHFVFPWDDGFNHQAGCSRGTEKKTNQVWLDHHEVRFQHEQWAGVSKTKTRKRRSKTPWTKTKTLWTKTKTLAGCLSSKKRYPVWDKNPQKRTLAGCTSPLSPYKGIPPPLGVLGLRFWVFVLEHPKRPTVRDENEFRDDPATTDSFSLLPWSSWLVEDVVSGRLEFERLSSSWTTCLMIESIVGRKYKMAAVR